MGKKDNVSYQPNKMVDTCSCEIWLDSIRWGMANGSHLTLCSLVCPPPTLTTKFLVLIAPLQLRFV